MQNQNKKINILFTSVGRRVELIQEWKTALGNNGVNGNIFGTDIDPLASAMQIIDKGIIVSRTESPEYISQIIQICKSNKIDLIFPLIDPDIPVLARNKNKIENTGAKLVLIDKKFVDLAQDKWNTYKLFNSLGLNTPRSWLPSDSMGLDKNTYPVFIKPRTGSASIGAQKAISKQHLEKLIENTEYPIIQEFIEGDEITCDVICGLGGNVLSIIQRQRIEVRSGEVSKGKTVFNQEVMDSCIKIAGSMGAIGPITIQCIIKKNTPYFIEINPRYGGGAPLGIAAGATSPEWYIKEFLGLKCDVPGLGEYKRNLYMTRADQTFFLNEEDLLRIKNNNI
ncbi:MAG: ATP-grasp domain-containing protein [Mariniphaga sp.]|nr:ATP-grasp domain-containing protein [Mariniphaga sp.]